MRKVIGFMLAGWPFVILGVLIVIGMYQELGLRGSVLALLAMVCTGGSVYFGLNLALGTKGR